MKLIIYCILNHLPDKSNLNHNEDYRRHSHYFHHQYQDLMVENKTHLLVGMYSIELIKHTE